MSGDEGDSTHWKVDAISGISVLDAGAWLALVERKRGGWHYLVHNVERTDGFRGAMIQSQRGFQKRVEAQQAAEAVMVEQGGLTSHTAAALALARGSTGEGRQ